MRFVADEGAHTAIDISASVQRCRDRGLDVIHTLYLVVAKERLLCMLELSETPRKGLYMWIIACHSLMVGEL